MFRRSKKNYTDLLSRFVFAKVYFVKKEDAYYYGFANIVPWKYSKEGRTTGPNTVYFRSTAMKRNFYFGHRVFKMQARPPRNGDLILGEVERKKKGLAFAYFFIDSKRKRVQNFLSNSNNVFCKIFDGHLSHFLYDNYGKKEKKRRDLLEAAACICVSLAKHNELFLYVLKYLNDREGGKEEEDVEDSYTLENLNKILM